jgi:predicted dehydrogenase
MSRKARIAVIGTGWWATDYHLPGLRSHPDAEVTAICDPDPERLRKAAEAYEVSKTYADYKEMLAREELDGAIVVTPHATHYPIARACLERGLHLLLEKPMTLFAREAGELVRMAEEKGKALMICYPYHYMPQALRASAVIRSGELGEVQYAISSFTSDMTNFLGGRVSAENPPTTRFKVQGPSQAYNDPEMMGGGQGHLQLTHSIGLLFFVTGLRARRVYARMSNHGRQVDMVDAMTVEFENGALGLIGGSGLARVGAGMSLSVYCADGCFVGDTVARGSAILRKDGSREDLAQAWSRGNPYPVPHNFVGVVLGREENGSPGENGVRVVEVLDAAYRSAKEEGRGVFVDELYY